MGSNTMQAELHIITISKSVLVTKNSFFAGLNKLNIQKYKWLTQNSNLTFYNDLLTICLQIQNYKGAARIVVSLVTNDEVPKPHAHSLVGKNCANGMCTVQVGPSDMTAT